MKKPSSIDQICDVLLLGFEDWENLGLRYIAAYLSEHRIKVQILPLTRSKDDILSFIQRSNPKLIGFSLIFQRMLNDFADLINYLRVHGVKTHITIGGHFPSTEPEAAMAAIPGLDSIIKGEGEETLLELFNHRHRPDEWEQIQGLVFRNQHNGGIQINPPRSKIEPLDSLPFPIRSNDLPKIRGLGLCSILASRGCYYDCSFCSIHTFYAEMPGPRRRTRTPENVVDEIEQLFHQRDMRIFVFEDDDLFMRGRIQREWIDGLVNELKRRGLAKQILFRVSCRVDDVDPEPIEKLMGAGLRSVYIGIESGNNLGLQTFNKHYNVEDIHRSLVILREFGVPYEYGFMMLHPDATFDTVQEDIEFLKEISAYGDAVLQFTKMLPYSGTPINRRLKKEGRLIGCLAALDYKFLDPRLDLYQLFLSEAFHVRNFDPKGLSEQLRFAKLDVSLVKKFFAAKYDANEYASAVRELIRRSNEEALEKMSMAIHFMADRSQEEIINNWWILEQLVYEEKAVEAQLTAALDWLMKKYEFEAEF
jgi:radical SAM superfamily enzyme YgiQ (UPF0313 family)